MKKSYETPVVKQLGSFETLTKAATNGNALDATFVTNTPNPELTFS